ncbi:threonylcarbamoyl-AMP synthase, partial [Candidatus Parcubacteria bacterium]|nr:threonylcarbamoyl-AMP synthase [Candidatus Parcubacteria bacterium]
MKHALITDPVSYRRGMTEAAECLRRGGVVVVPADTGYCLVADAANEEAVRRVFKIKGRPFTKPVPVFVASIAMAKTAAFIDQRTERTLTGLWPGQVTVVMPARAALASAVTAGGSTVGVRLPDHPVPVALAQKLGRPMVGTSATVSDEPSRQSVGALADRFRQRLFRPDLVLDVGDLEAPLPLTVLDVSSGAAKIVRVGPVSKATLARILEPTP